MSTADSPVSAVLEVDNEALNGESLAEMRRHKLYIDNYCTSRVILYEAQYFSTSAIIIGIQRVQVSFLFYIMSEKVFN